MTQAQLFDLAGKVPAWSPGARDPLDRYYTPDEVAQACVACLPDGADATAWEPSVGGGSFARALQAHGFRLWVSDLDPAAPGLATPGALWSTCGDFLRLDPTPGADWIVGNGPYGSAPREWCEVATRRARVGAAFLVRAAVRHRLSDYAEGKLAQCWHLYPRPGFGGPAMGGRVGTDASEYAFLIFRHDWSGPAESRRLVWR